MAFLRCVPNLARNLALGVAFICAATVAKAGDSLTISREFNLITSKNASGYFKPLFTTIGESFNSNAFTVARYARQWRLGLDISVCGMIIPSSQTTYDATLPDEYGNTSITQTAERRGGTETRNTSGTVSQPTVYGGVSTPTFSAPQTGIPPSEIPKQPSTVAFMEGNNISFMSGLPAIQIGLGLPTRTQLKFRFATFPLQDVSTTYFGIMGSQQFNHLVGLFADDSLIGVALNAGYHSLARNQGISISSFAVGLHGSKTWESGFSLYGGVQYENLSGSITLVREKDFSIISKSPYSEIRNQEDLKMDVASFTDMRVGAGISYKTGILELHADAAYASQPILAAGFTLWFMSIDADTRKNDTLDDSYEINKNKRGN
ncbi:hypothetical protein MASR2M18_15960 [Ignavibacteria bacterium]